MTEFKPDDFSHDGSGMILIGWRQAAEFANARLPALKAQWLAELVEGAPKLELIKTGAGIVTYSGQSFIGGRLPTHTARLVCVEEIGK